MASRQTATNNGRKLGSNRLSAARSTRVAAPSYTRVRDADTRRILQAPQGMPILPVNSGIDKGRQGKISNQAVMEDGLAAHRIFAWLTRHLVA